MLAERSKLSHLSRPSGCCQDSQQDSLLLLNLMENVSLHAQSSPHSPFGKTVFFHFTSDLKNGNHSLKNCIQF
ncbi:hypothetical protein ATANTOWER_001509 [Ataeniobius toweri]|uniref:Uncharacterized protein n=1 Tax=Ataeniobius toweri TaxID=208326 RepID=A0ABU7A4X2_9TELE|nr:hypothetical protein [Ataeniobius toweri]